MCKGVKLFSIAILCGGKSKRFGSDKTFHYIGDKTILELVYDKFKNETDDIFLQTSNNDKYRKKKFRFNVNKYHDVIPEKGPLGGIYSALSNAKFNRVFVVAGDLPFVDEKIIAELTSFEDFSIVVPKWLNGFVEPLCALYSKDVMPIVRKRIDSNNLKINDFFQELGNDHTGEYKIKYLHIEDLIHSGKISENCFNNINCLEDLDTIN
jgi:molybdopterin-guanine dinucleotide biosynthesis protein A